MPVKTNIEKTLDIVAQIGIVRPRDFDEHNVPRRYLSLLHQRGLLRRIGRGLYELPGADVTEHWTIVQVSKRVPGGVVCLLSALRFHDLTSQHPHEVWLALDRTKNPIIKAKDLPIRKMRFSGPAFSEGIEEHEVSGVSVKVYNVAKTIVDCFKYRNKIGLDVALEALRECRRERLCKSDDLWYYAKICRVTNVMQPYLEAMS